MAPLATGALLLSCSSMDFGGYLDKFDGEDRGGGMYAESPDDDGGVPGEPGAGNGENGGDQASAGRITAGEWRDLDHWDFWSDLMLGEEFSEMSHYWRFYTDNLVAVQYTDADEKPVIGAKVVLLKDGVSVWTAKTDNKGYAWCWASPFAANVDLSGSKLSLNIDGTEITGQPEVTYLQSKAAVKINKYVKPASQALPKINQVTDIAFIVDATGSMEDEIDFLKEDLVDILGKAAEKASAETVIRTASVFYRDIGDAYLTRVSDFSTDVTTTADFIKDQGADGGGDYPEAVHTALETSLQKLSWGEESRMRVAFLLLDAPAHYTSEVLTSLQKSIETYARMGIRIIPIAASGADKNTEFMLRFFDILTGGTYTFLTDHSGVGGGHIKASVGDYEVEALNDLIVRLIVDVLG